MSLFTRKFLIENNRIFGVQLSQLFTRVTNLRCDTIWEPIFPLRKYFVRTKNYRSGVPLKRTKRAGSKVPTTKTERPGTSRETTARRQEETDREMNGT